MRAYNGQMGNQGRIQKELKWSWKGNQGTLKPQRLVVNVIERAPPSWNRTRQTNFDIVMMEWATCWPTSGRNSGQRFPQKYDAENAEGRAVDLRRERERKMFRQGCFKTKVPDHSDRYYEMAVYLQGK